MIGRFAGHESGAESLSDRTYNLKCTCERKHSGFTSLYPFYALKVGRKKELKNSSCKHKIFKIQCTVYQSAFQRIVSKNRSIYKSNVASQ